MLSNGNGSLTGLYMRGSVGIPVPSRRRKAKPRRQLKFIGAQVHNLKNLDVAIPLGVMTDRPCRRQRCHHG